MSGKSASESQITNCFQAHTAPVMDITYNDGTLCSGSRDGTLILWDLQSCSLTKRFQAHQGSVNTVLPLESKLIISSGVDGCVKVFDVREKAAVANILVSHSDKAGMASIGCMAVSPQSDSGGWIVTGGADSSVSVFDIRSSQSILHRWSHHKNAVYSLLVVGKHGLISGGGEGMMLFYDLRRATNDALLHGLSGSEHGAVQCILKLDQSILACGESGKVLGYRYN